MSSKASRLGTSASFGNARPVSARREAINSATKAPTEGAPPPVVLPLRHISLNPANPRATLGDLTALAGSLRDHGQKQAITLMARDAYLAANPDQREHLEADTSYVVIDGNSRLAAAREAGLATLKVMVDDDLGSDPDELLESALVANIHRQDLAPLDEARALQALLKVHGSQRKLAARLHRSQGWVAQRLALLGLTPELQRLLERKEESVELLRAVGNKPAEEQQAEFERLKQAKVQEEAERDRQRTARPAPEGDYAVITPEASEAAEPTPVSGRQRTDGSEPARARPARPQDTGDRTAAAAMPWQDPRAVLAIARQWMTPENYRTLLKLADEAAG